MERNSNIQLFDWLNSITYNNNLEMEEGNESSYDPYIILKGLGQHQDTVLYACEMNKYCDLSKKMQYDYLVNVVRKKKRYGKWVKPEVDPKFEIVSLYYDELSPTKIKQILPFINKTDLEAMEKSMFRGGRT